MKCCDCGSEELLGTVVIIKRIPLNQKGGGLNMKGQKVGQPDVKEAWSTDKFGKDKEVYGPIQCVDCGAEHVYIPGETPALRLGDYWAEFSMVAHTKEHFLSSGEEEDEDDEGNE